MRIAFVGDSHGNLDLMYARALEWQAENNKAIDYIFQVGDFGIWPNIDSVDSACRRHAEKEGLDPAGDFRSYVRRDKEVPIPTYFIRGNHESQVFLRNYQKIQTELYPDDYLTRSIEICPGLNYVPDGHIINIGGVRIAGWGGNFAWKTWSSNLSYWDPQLFNNSHTKPSRRLNHMTRDVFERLIREPGIDVVVTHDGPSGIGLEGRGEVDLPEEEMTGGGVPFIRELIEASGCRLSLSGHWHHYLRAQIGQSEHYSLSKVHTSVPASESMFVWEVNP